MAKTLYVLNGPNLNLLGTREPEIYGRATLADIKKLCAAAAKRHGLALEFPQSNHEGEIIDWIHQARERKAVGIVINPVGYTTTSLAIFDAILAVGLPVIEVHITNIHAREPFRQRSYISKCAKGVICGFGIEGYRLAIDGLAALTGVAKG